MTRRATHTVLGQPLRSGRFALEIARYLIDVEGVKMVVVACNTASSVALDELRATMPVPVVGVLEPGLRSALRATRSGEVGVIGTVGTISSGAYQRLAESFAGEARVHCLACPGFVEFVERGEIASDQVHVLAERLLSPLIDREVDTLVARMHALPLSGADDRGRDGATGRPRLAGRGDRVRHQGDPLDQRYRSGLGDAGCAPIPFLGRRRALRRDRSGAARS